MLESLGDEQLYGAAGQQLAETCRARNENTIKAWTCARVEIRQADELLELVGDPARISDPAFQPLADHAAYEATLEAEAQALEALGVPFWSNIKFEPAS